MNVRHRYATFALLTGLLAPLATGLAPVRAQEAGKPAADEPVPTFAVAYMNDAANIKLGEQVWQEQCRHCHGNSAYPGKAPKLNPGAMDADHIFDRVTNGFRKMPSWKQVFSYQQRMGVVAYIKSDSFSP